MADADPYLTGSATAAHVAAVAALLAASAADRSRAEWSEAGGARAQAQILRDRALQLGERGSVAYVAARKALASRLANPSGQAASTEDQGARDWRLGVAVEEAAGPPLELAASAADLAALAATIAAHATGDARVDAVVAAILGAAAARAAEQLVRVNLVVGDREAGRLAGIYAQAASRAVASAEALGF